MIVKVQVSLEPVDGVRHVLVYNESRSVQAQFEASQDVLDLMAGVDKAFYEARIVDSQVLLGDPVPDQGW